MNKFWCMFNELGPDYGVVWLVVHISYWNCNKN